MHVSFLKRYSNEYNFAILLDSSQQKISCLQYGNMKIKRPTLSARGNEKVNDNKKEENQREFNALPN